MELTMYCFFVSDLHGKIEKYEKLFTAIKNEKPDLVFLGGDLLPHFFKKNFAKDFIRPALKNLSQELKENYPKILVILGNDDPKIEERNIIEIAEENLWHYIHLRKLEINNYKIYGYSFTPPSPFLLKDWEKYDVSRYTGIGCISPEHGMHTVEVPKSEIKFSTIKNDLEIITDKNENTNSIFISRTTL